ncbi:aryl hydrocarbon receptor isoform X2 [Myotis daubentonii]|uniref:aryl hydrocarbon receptor isoform X2 n=1 Tax=Myotis daubentonii TaxID=98922 RepID=UPI00287376AE|nr:aryl hydrocarbon receptor isoform X2 [Myotis daubentonii]
MNGSSANITYASRKRRKPVQKTIKPIPAEGIKSNPSKRHRDRLNTELDRLANLLPFPQDVINKLDKLSVLRLSVSYLRAKSFFDGSEWLCVGCHYRCLGILCFFYYTRLSGISAEANGLLQPAVYYDPDQLPPENSSFMERCFICRLRCLLDNSSGFLAMNFQGRLKYLHGQNKKGKDGSVLPPQLALFAIATPLQPPSILEIRTKNFIFRTKHKLDFTPTGCDAKGKLVLGYTEAELCMKGSGYQFLHAADMLYCAEYHMRMIKTGESGMIVFRLLTKGNRWTWIQSNARLVYKNGRPDYIIATQRPLTDEEGTEHLKKRNMKLPFMFATGEAVLYETTNPFPPMMDPLPVRTKNVASGKDSATQATLNKDSPHPSSLFSAIMQQDESIYLCPASNSDPFERIFLNESMDKCNKWQDSIAPVGSDILEHEQIDQSQEMNPTLSEGHGGLFPDNNNSDLYSIMKHLGVDFEDIKHMQQNEEFFRTDFSGENDFSRDIDLTDEILTFVQDSLNKSTLACPGYQQQPSRALNSSCMVQEHLQLEQQQQLCQKMKNMQVNGMFANWSSNHSVPFNCPQQDLQQYNVFSDLPGTNQEFPYKSEIDTMPYTQNFIPCNSSVLPQQSQGTQLDFPLGNFEPSPYPTATSNLEDFVTCLQAPENQKHKLNLQSSLVTPQTCYAGAVSMYPYQLEPQQSNAAQIQYSPNMPGPQAFLTKFPNGVLNEIYPAELNTINNSQTTTHLQSLHHPSETGPFPDLTSSRFL